MFSKSSVSYSVLSAFLFCFVVGCITMTFSTRISAQPTASIGNLFGSATNKIEEVEAGGAGSALERKAGAAKQESAEQSFQAFINSKPAQESTVIGQINPNASELEKVLLRTKIKNTIEAMQSDTSKKSASEASAKSLSGARAECYIEVTRVEKVPGKCHRASSGLPICQSDNYMTISSECK